MLVRSWSVLALKAAPVLRIWSESLSAFCIVATYVLLSRRLPLLTRAPIPCGIAYGLIVYAVMNYIVIPLSATARGVFSWPVFLNGIAIHMLGVGLPASLFARAALTTRDTPRPTPSV